MSEPRITTMVQRGTEGGVDFVETDEHRDLRAAVGAVAAPFGGGYYVEHARAGQECTELWRALGDAGFIGVNIPEEHGGGGGGLVELALVVEEAAAKGAPMLLLLVTAAISAEVISEYGSDEQRRRWLPRLATGRTKVVFAITEPEAGSNTHRLATNARREGPGNDAEWVLNGEKYYISGVDHAEALLLVARTGRDESGRAALSLFLVPTDAPGLTATRLPVDVMLPEAQFTLHLDDVRLPADALVGQQGQGFRQVFHGLNPERVTGAALGVGIARYALERAARYANEREVWGRPIGTHQGVSHPLAQAKIETELAALMTQKAAWLHDRGLPAGEAANMAKYAAAEAALAAIDAAVQAHGGNGVSQEFGLLPYWGLARLLRIAPVNREMILNFVAQHSLGLPRSY
jgi:alkylation response protein AidB-like acyl-CoA dehydrogenase